METYIRASLSRKMMSLYIVTWSDRSSWAPICHFFDPVGHRFVAFSIQLGTDLSLFADPIGHRSDPVGHRFVAFPEGNFGPSALHHMPSKCLAELSTERLIRAGLGALDGAASDLEICCGFGLCKLRLVPPSL